MDQGNTVVSPEEAARREEEAIAQEERDITAGVQRSAGENSLAFGFIKWLIRMRRHGDYKGPPLGGLPALRPGDVLIKYGDGSLTSIGIQAIQNFWHKYDKPAWFVHAALVTGPQSDLHALEMSGEGMFYNNLRSTNLPYSYEVFRPVESAFAEAVTELSRPLADMAAADQRVTNYDYAKLPEALESRVPIVTRDAFEREYRALSGEAAGERRKFYCSEFIVWLYQGAKYRTGRDSPLWATSEQVSPAILAWQMTKEFPGPWQHIGSLPRDVR